MGVFHGCTKEEEEEEEPVQLLPQSLYVMKQSLRPGRALLKLNRKHLSSFPSFCPHLEIQTFLFNINKK